MGVLGKLLKTGSKVVKKVKKNKTYGDKGQYSRAKDMKKSEFYRDRHNSGKSYKGDDNKTAELIGWGSLGAIGTGGMIANKNSKKSKEKKPVAKQVINRAKSASKKK